MDNSDVRVSDLAMDDYGMNLIEAVAGASMDVDITHFDPSDPEEMVLRALDDMLPDEVSEMPEDDGE